MKKPVAFNYNGEDLSLQDAVEIFAVSIAEEIMKSEKRIEDVMQDCKILDSLSGALLAIKK